MSKLVDIETIRKEIEQKENKYYLRGEESDRNHDGKGMYWGGVISTLNEILTMLDTIPEKKPKWLYRLEYKDNSCGLWYNGNGEWCFESGIGSLGDSCKTKSLPMDYDGRYKADGKDWFSSCSKKEDLLHWYSEDDAKALLANGFVFTRYLAVDYTEYEQQTVFLKEAALCREEIDFFALMHKEERAVDLEDALKEYCSKYYNYNYPEQGENCARIMPHIIEAAHRFFELGESTGYQKARGEFAKIKAELWSNAYKEGYERAKYEK